MCLLPVCILLWAGSLVHAVLKLTVLALCASRCLSSNVMMFDCASSLWFSSVHQTRSPHAFTATRACVRACVPAGASPSSSCTLVLGRTFDKLTYRPAWEAVRSVLASSEAVEGGQSLRDICHGIRAAGAKGRSLI